MRSLTDHCAGAARRFSRLALALILAAGSLACSFSADVLTEALQPQGPVNTDVDVLADEGSSTVQPTWPAVTAAPTPTSPVTTIWFAGESPPNNPEAPDFEALEQYMLELVNEDRQAAGLEPLQWDGLAAETGRRHAAEMARYTYLSHWNLAGNGPDIRYSLVGGTEVVQENVYAYYQRYETGTPVPVDDWQTLVRQAEEQLMASEGHRANILNPAHTHLGVGIAYAPETGELRIAHEFLNRYIAFDRPQNLPVRARPGDRVVLSGALLNGAVEPLINLNYEPFPEPMSLDELLGSSTYVSPAEFISAQAPEVSETGAFRTEVRIPAQALPGYYHIRFWVMVAGAQTQAADILVQVGERPS